MLAHLEGLIAAPFTAMKADGGVSLEVIEKQVEFLLRNDVMGAFVCGVTGECMSLTTPERLDITRRWVEVAPEGFKVIVHVGHTSLEVSKVLAAHAQEAGAWGIGAMAPPFFRPASLKDLVASCRVVVSSAPELPFYYYHIPSMTGMNFTMVDFLRAAGNEIPNLVGIKYTGEDLMDYGLCRQLEGGRFDMLFGRDELLICALALGARGAVGSTYNFAAPLYSRLMEVFAAGDLETARNLQLKSMELIDLLKRSEGSFLACGKAVMTMLGVDCGPTRLPLENLTVAQAKNLHAQLEHIGFFEYCSR